MLMNRRYLQAAAWLADSLRKVKVGKEGARGLKRGNGYQMWEGNCASYSHAAAWGKWSARGEGEDRLTVRLRRGLWTSFPHSVPHVPHTFPTPSPSFPHTPFTPVLQVVLQLIKLP